MLMLLATIGHALGKTGLTDYEPPAERFREEYAAPVNAARPPDPNVRYAQIAAAAAALGGDA